MTLRVTRQSLEVAQVSENPLPKALRVSRQVVEVLIRPTIPPIELSASSELSVTSTADRGVVFNRGADQALALLGIADWAADFETFDRSAISLLVLSQEATVSLANTSLDVDATTTVALVQAGGIAVTRNLSASSTLALTQTASRAADRSLDAQNVLEVRQGCMMEFESPSIVQYAPVVGINEDPNAPAPPPLTLAGPMDGIEARFQLVYPAAGDVTDSVSLRAPNLGNRDRLSFNRIQRETRGGTLIVFADPQWPKVQTLVLSFSGLYRVEARALLKFMEDHLGEEIGLIDWEHRYWKGVIVTTNDPIVEDARDSYTASFEFDGELDPIWSPQIIPLTPRTKSTDESRTRNYRTVVEAEEPTEMDGVVVFYEAEALESVSIGSPVYVTEQATVRLAQATSASRCNVAGFSTTESGIGVACKYISEGEVHRDDWTAISGTVNLTPGAAYFLDITLGKITRNAPVVPGQYVVRVGRAVSPLILDVEIEDPILL
jgi:hypothetical protein